MWRGVILQYGEYLPVMKGANVVTLLEGGTPLIKAENFKEYLKTDCEIFLKYEGANPTGSFKDRGMTVAITNAKANNKDCVICASTGNTAASAAAYSAKANLKCFVLLPKASVAPGKLIQALIYNAKVIEVEGSFDNAIRLVKEASQTLNITLVNSINPDRIEGQKTAAFEIIDALQTAPDYHIIPVGNGGNITAYWKGFKEYASIGKTKKLPKMIGIQAQGAAPIVNKKPIENPQTIASAIRIGNPVNWQKAQEATEESQGLMITVSDKEIVEGMFLIARLEGLFVEPASAAAVSGLIKLSKQNYFKGNSIITLTLTGNGLKDSKTTEEFLPQNQRKVLRYLSVDALAELVYNS